MDKQTREILIVGGGFTGAALACALADGRRRITVLEARPGPRASFAGELIHPTGVAVLASLGLRPVLERAGAVAITGFAVFRSGDALPSLLGYEGAPGVHTTGLAIDHDRMVAALRAEAAARPGVALRYGERVTALRREGGRVVGVATEGGEHRADLVLAAEGRHGKLRTLLGIPVESRLISYTAALRIRGARLPVAAAGHIFLGADGPILAYPIGPDEARACFDLPEAVHPGQLAGALRQRYLPHLPAALAAAMDRALDEEPAQLVATHGMRAARTVQDGMALVGDAGGCAHPLTAGGMTLCLNDIRLLRGALAAEGGDLDGALDAYQRERLPMARTRIALTDALYAIFARPDPGLERLREAVFDYWRQPARRAASMALLAGAEVRPSRLALEYARVVGQALRGPDRLPALRAALAQAATSLRTVRG